MKFFFLLLSLCVSSCSSTPEENETYKKDIKRQASSMSKNIGKSGVRRSMNKGGNSIFEKMGL